MLVTTLTRRLSMVILSQTNETLDTILSFSKKITKDIIVKRLESIDDDYYCFLDHSRFELISKRPRTLLTSYGIITYNRRYYYDHHYERYIYLLDNQLEIPPNIRMSNELILKILDLASSMTYKEVGKHLSDEFELSKFTICQVIKNASIEAIYNKNINRKRMKVHLQIDEKFVGMIDSKQKKKYYTATIFAGKKLIGKKRHQLLNKTVLSSSSLMRLKERINYHLKKRYKVKQDEEIYLSGDLASYIQNFKDDIHVCKARYVPDKFHVYKTLRDLLPDLIVDAYSLNNKGFRKWVANQLEEKYPEDTDAKKIVRLIKNNSNCFQAYLDKKYLGCSQEGQNSHIYSPRFGKYANRFAPSTIEKLSLIREAIAMDSTIKIAAKGREIDEKIEIDLPKYDFSELEKFTLDTREMKYETRKMFEQIKYGNYN